MNTQLLQKDISKELGLDEMTSVEQEVFVSEIGEMILDSALAKLIIELNEEQLAALSYYLEDEPSAEVLMKHLFDHYSNFEDLIKEEIIAFKEESAAIFGGLDADMPVAV